MMNVLLKRLQKMPLTLPACEAFMLRAARLTIIRELSMDDWVYLAHLVSYRTTTRLSASDRDKELVVRTMRRIAEEKDRLSSAFN